MSSLYPNEEQLADLAARYVWKIEEVLGCPPVRTAGATHIGRPYTCWRWHFPEPVMVNLYRVGNGRFDAALGVWLGDVLIFFSHNFGDDAISRATVLDRIEQAFSSFVQQLAQRD